MAKELVVNRSKQSISVGEIHESYHICWPWDLDFWFELNNGRALTLYDLGRIPFSGRSGFSKVIFKKNMGLVFLRLGLSTLQHANGYIYHWSLFCYSCRRIFYCERIRQHVFPSQRSVLLVFDNNDCRSDSRSSCTIYWCNCR